MFEADRLHWDNFHQWDEHEVSRRAGTFCVPNAQLDLHAIGPHTLVDRLTWMLCTRRASWHRHAMPLSHARRLVAHTLAAIFSLPRGAIARGPERRRELVRLIRANAHAVRVASNFLFQMKDDGEVECAPGCLSYFCGGIGDSCTIIFCGTRMTVVLTNGSP